MQYSKETDSILQMGNLQISSNEFISSYQKNLQEIQGIIPESHIPKKEIANLTLTQLIQKNLLLKYAHSIGLTVTTEQLVNFIKKMPIFFDPNGHFNEKKMDFILQQNHLTRKKFLQNITNAILIKQLTPIIDFPFLTPKPIAKYMLQIIYSPRTLFYFTIPYHNIIHKTPQPSAKEKRQYYIQHKEFFSIPESRVVEFLLLPSDFLKEKITCTKQEIQSAYQANKKLFIKPEYRSILVMSFTTKKQAESAYNILQKTHNFLQVAKLKGLAKDSLELKHIKQSDIPDPSLQKYAFSLKNGEYSQPIHSRFGWVIIKIKNILPAHMPSLNEIKRQLILQLKTKKNIELLESLKKEIDHQLLKKNDLDYVAKSMNLPFQLTKIQSNSSFHSIQNMQIPNLDKMIFNAQINTTSPALHTKNGYLYFRVKQIIPKAYKSLVQVDQQIISSIQKNFIDQYVDSWAKKYVNQIQKNPQIIKKTKQITFTLHALPSTKNNLPNDFIQKTIKTFSNTWTFFADNKKNILYVGMLSKQKNPDLQLINKKMPIFLRQINENRIDISSRQILQALYEKTNVKINYSLIEQIIR